MVKNKRTPTEELANFFEAAKSSSSKINPDLAARILRDADIVHNDLNSLQNRSWSNKFLDFLKDLGGVPSTVGFATSLMMGVYIGFYSPDWSEPVASLFYINSFEDINLTGSFLEMNELY